MSKMGQELDKRLDENKYEMYRTLVAARDILNVTQMLDMTERVRGNVYVCLDKIDEVLSKVEGKNETV